MGTHPCFLAREAFTENPKIRSRPNRFPFSIALLCLAWHLQVQANCSMNTAIPTTIHFTNSSSDVLDLIWVDTNCAEHVIAKLNPGQSHLESTYKNDIWRTRNAINHNLSTETQAIAGPATVNITGLNPPPLGQIAKATSGTLKLPAAKLNSAVSPHNTSFVDPLPIPVTMTPVGALNPVPSNATNPFTVPVGKIVNAKLGGNTVATVNLSGFAEATRPDHQKWTLFGGTSQTAPGFSGDMYESVEMEVPWSFYPAVDNVPSSKIWTFVETNTGAIGPLRINAHYGRPIIHRIHNSLPIDNGGFGINQTSTHLHNGHNASESDGGPTHFYDAGEFKDYHYPNVRPGFSNNIPFSTLNGRTVAGDVKETMSFLWFHDHRFDFTSQNVYKGLVSFYTLFSDDILLDTGDESTGLRLPGGQYDIPLIFGDKNFDPATGQLTFDTGNIDGILGDKYTINGKIQPYMNVQKRKYRFRLLNGGTSRYYEFFLSNKGSFKKLSSDGNLLPSVITTPSIRLGVAERTDVIIDFTNIEAGANIYLQNRLEQLDGRGPTGKIIAPINLVEFRVQAGAVTDNSRIPATILPLPNKNAAVAKNRVFDFGRSNGAWTVNGEFFDPNTITIFVKQNSAEKWTFTSGGGWGHPVHPHLEEGQILNRDGKSTLAEEDIGRKDIYRIGEGALGTSGTGAIATFYQFRDFLGDYPIHCHNVVHEDHAMMTRFEIVQ